MAKFAPLSFAAAFCLALAAPPAWADDAPPLAMPDDASDVVYSSDAGSLTFNSAKSVKDLADFYRAEGKKKGWQETPSVINKDNMVVLDFTAGEDEVSVTVMKMGDKSMVTAEGAALEGKPAASADASSGSGSDSGSNSGSSDASATPADKPPPLEAGENNGLPTANGLGNMGSSSTMFSKSVTFSAPNSVADVVAFYRTELGKRGWTENSANITDTEAELAFTAPEGPAKLTVKRNGDMSDAELTLTLKDAAAKSPLAPNRGKVKILFGNLSDQDAVVTIAGKKVKVPAGAGSKGPDGPSLELKPGDLTAAMKGAKESFKVGPDTIWMVGIGPGGLIVVQQ